MATYPRTSNRSVPSCQALLLVLLLTLLGLLGCSASTPTSTRGLKGTISEFPLPTSNSPSGGITAGPDGNLWFTETIIINDVQSSEAKRVGKIGRITPTGQLREFLLPTPENQPNSITTGPDGALWFTEDSSINGQSGKIGRLA